MTKKEAQDFIDLNKEAFILLAEKIKTLDTVRGVTRYQDLVGRQQAIRIIKDWLTEIYQISLEDLPKPEEDDDIIRIINN